MKRIKYWIEEYDQNVDDCYELDVDSFDSDDLQWWAEQCAEDYHSNHDGWENNWPLTFSLANTEGKYLGKVEVEREAEPVFYGKIRNPK